ncbi:MAG TPA: HAD family phosphatase [Williamwhitmania sp.]|nr:HAD family phosphatase [Williamwhitmania sp.]
MQSIVHSLRNASIRNIIFDLGGVILPIDYHLTIQKFEEFGFTNFQETFTQATQIDLFDKLDKGLVEPEVFRTTIRTIAGKNLSDSQIDEAWNAMLLDFIPSRLNVLARVKEHYKTFLLSNTNAIHYSVYLKQLKEQTGIESLANFFNKEYYSHLIHLRKPDRETFELILNENGLKPEETLFIDDTLQHVEGARKAGLKAYHLKVNEDESIEQLFAHLL